MTDDVALRMMEHFDLHDPSVAKDEVEIRRTANRHMTFGRGVHRCLGSHLARLEVEVMIQQVLQRIPDYTIDESKLEVHPDEGLAYGYESVPMRFTPRHAHG